MLRTTLTRPVEHRLSHLYTFLVIGYGNELRGDDAAGAMVARTVADWNLPDVKVLVVHQLVPELSAEIAQAKYVIFVDACGEESCALSAQLNPISAKLDSAGSAIVSSTSLTHSHSVQGLLLLTQKVYGHAPPAWLLQVPTDSFDFNENLSSTAKRGCDQAVQTIERFLVNYRNPYQSN